MDTTSLVIPALGVANLCLLACIHIQARRITLLRREMEAHVEECVLLGNVGPDRQAFFEALIAADYADDAPQTDKDRHP